MLRAKAKKSDSAPKTPSDPTSSIYSACTVLWIRSALTVLVLQTLSDALLPARSTTWSGLLGVLSAATLRLMYVTSSAKWVHQQCIYELPVPLYLSHILTYLSSTTTVAAPLRTPTALWRLVPRTSIPPFSGMFKPLMVYLHPFSKYTNYFSIGERNGITPLGGLMARMIVADRDYVMSKYKYVFSQLNAISYSELTV